MSGGWLWISVAGIRMIQSSICRAMPGFLAPWGSFIPFPFLSSSLLKSSHHCHLRIKIFATCVLSYSPLESGKQWNSFIRREKEEKTADRKKQWRYPIQRHKTWWCRTKWDKRWKYTELHGNGLRKECSPKSSPTILSTKKKICRALFRIRRPCFKRKCTMRVNSVFRAALKSGVDTSSNLLSDSKSSVTKSYDIFFRRILRLLWLSEISQRKSFQLEMCLPGRLSRSNDFWSARRNWFHYFQIIKQIFLKPSFKKIRS